MKRREAATLSGRAQVPAAPMAAFNPDRTL